MSASITINTQGFSRMMSVLEKKTGMTFRHVTRAATGSILEGAARKTKKSSLKKIRTDTESRLARTFTAQDGSKVRKAKDGALVFRGNGWSSGKWLRLRNEYSLKPISRKNGDRAIDARTAVKINRALRENRAAIKTLVSRKKKLIASSQNSFLRMMRVLKIGIKNSRGLGAALKSRMTQRHKSAVTAREQPVGKDYSIVLKSHSQAALNPHSGGIRAFRSSFNGQVKAFEKACEKDMEEYVARFAKRNGFILRR